jgi:hypothetical protein
MTHPDAGHPDGGGPTCDLTFEYPLNWACNSDGDCRGHHCVFPQIGQPQLNGQVINPGVCTTTCQDPGSTDECMTGYTCNYGYNVTSNGPGTVSAGYFCQPDDPTTPGSKNASLPLGSPCWSNADCAGAGAACGAYIYSDPGAGFSYAYTFCSDPCAASASDSCGDCGTCGYPFGGSQAYCEFKGPSPIGAPCVHHSDCDSFFCELNFCTQACSTSMPCPDGAVCQTFTLDGQSGSLCVAQDQIGGTADGDVCVFDFQCKAHSQCAQNALGQTVCTPPSALGQTCETTSQCAPGLDCRQFTSSLSECSQDCGAGCPAGDSCTAPNLSMEIRLYNTTLGGPGDFITDSVYYPVTDPGAWTEIPNYYLQAGSYWVSIGIYQFGTNYVGNYTLRITDATGTPVPWRSLPNTPISHGTLQTAQLIPFPVDLSGTIATPTQTDFYEIKTTQADSIKIEALPGDPSACLPTPQLGGTALGEPCLANFNCVTGLTCEPSLSICTQTCSTDTDCGGNGNACKALSGGMFCVSAAQIGANAAGAKCQYDWQCASGDTCVVDQTSSVCAAPCGAMMSCDATSECSAAQDVTNPSPDGGMPACLPLGNRSTGFGGSCVLQSDCEMGLACTSGPDGKTCQKTCTASSDCPYQSGFSTDPLVCKQCQDSSDCTTSTEEGACVSVDTNEQFCLLLCDAQGNCPAGFACNLLYGANFTAAQVCEPQDSSCHTPICATTTPDGGTPSSACAVPPADYAGVCQSNSDCTTSLCANNVCTHACQTDDECNCPNGDLVCTSGSCALTNYPKSMPGNNSVSTPQVLSTTLPSNVIGTTGFSNNSPQQSFFSISLTGGTTVDIVTRPLCGYASSGAMTNLYVYGPNGTLVAQDAYSGTYGHLHDLSIAQSGSYIIDVEEGAFSPVPSNEYVLTISQGTAQMGQ